MKKQVSIKDIAQELHISLSTVHKALTGKPGISDAKRKEVVETAQRMGYVVNSVAQSLARKDIKLGIVMPSRWNEYFSSMKQGMEEKILSLQKYKVRGLFYYLTCDICEKEAEKLTSWLKTEHIDALIYCPSSYTVAESFFLSVRSLDIPVFFAGDSYDADAVTSVIATDATLSGNLAADFLHILHRRNLRAAVLTGSLSIKPHKEKTDAFRKRVRANGGKVVGIYETGDDDKAAYECMDQICSIGANGVYVSTATSLPVCKYIEEKGLEDEITLICTDVFPELQRYMKESIAKATICQNQAAVGKRAVRAAYDYFVSKNSYGREKVKINPVLPVRPHLSILADIDE